jgi:hypothetical protein
VEDEQREDWERVTRSLGAGFLVRWDQHDPEALEQEVGPMTRQRVGQRGAEEAWFG